MSYYGTSNAHLAFPSYSQQGLQRNMNNLNTLSSSVPQIHQQYRNHLPQQLQPGQNASGLSAGAQNGQNQNVLESLPPEAENAKSKNTDPELEDDKLGKRERKNRPGQKFGAKKKSWVWTWFVQDSRDPNVAVCDYCGKIITRQPSDKGLPKKLSEHLKTHKLTRDLINTSRPVPVDGNGITYSPNGLQMPNYKNSYNSQNQNHGHSSNNSGLSLANGNAGNAAMSNPQLNNMLQQTLQQNQSLGLGHSESGEMSQPKPTKYRRTGNMVNGVQSGVGSVPGASSGPGGSSNRIMSIGGAGSVDERLQMHQQAQNHQLARQSGVGSPALHGRRYILPNFDNSPYSAGKFHKHLLHFLADNKLSIRLLKLHSFQQLIYDLRPDLITDLLELSGLYSSFVEVSRVDTDPDAQDGHRTSLAESNVVNTLAQNLPRGD